MEWDLKQVTTTEYELTMDYVSDGKTFGWILNNTLMKLGNPKINPISESMDYTIPQEHKDIILSQLKSATRGDFKRIKKIVAEDGIKIINADYVDAKFTKSKLKTRCKILIKGLMCR